MRVVGYDGVMMAWWWWWFIGWCGGCGHLNENRKNRGADNEPRRVKWRQTHICNQCQVCFIAPAKQKYFNGFQRTTQHNSKHILISKSQSVNISRHSDHSASQTRYRKVWKYIISMQLSVLCGSVRPKWTYLFYSICISHSFII